MLSVRGDGKGKSALRLGLQVGGYVGNQTIAAVSRRRSRTSIFDATQGRSCCPAYLGRGAYRASSGCGPAEALAYLCWNWLPLRAYALQVGHVCRAQAAWIDACVSNWDRTPECERLQAEGLVREVIAEVEIDLASFDPPE